MKFRNISRILQPPPPPHTHTHNLSTYKVFKGNILKLTCTNTSRTMHCRRKTHNNWKRKRKKFSESMHAYREHQMPKLFLVVGTDGQATTLRKPRYGPTATLRQPLNRPSRCEVIDDNDGAAQAYCALLGGVNARHKSFLHF